MTEPGNLNDFFNTFKKKDKKKKTAKAAAEDKPSEEKAAADTTKDSGAQPPKAEASADAHDTQVATKSKKKTTAIVDSDEEDVGIVLRDDVKAKLKTKTDVDATKRTEEEKKNEADGLGWSFATSKGTPATAKAAEPEPVKKTAGAADISFGKGPPKFTRAVNNNKVIQKQEFPELGDFGSKRNNNEVLKKDGNYGANEASTSAASSAPPRQEKQEFKMPIFTGKAKLNFGTGEEDTGSRQYTYDMSSLKKSAPSSKPVFKGDGDKNRGGQRSFGGPAAGSGAGDDDFEMVTDKKKVKGPRGGYRRDED